MKPRDLENHAAGIKRDAFAPEAPDHPLQRRQSSQCVTPCAWTNAAENCATLQCVCELIASTTQQQFLSCLDCAETYNATYADIIISFAEQCGIPIPTGAAPVSPPSSTGVPCESQCAWTDASAQCTSLQCDCQVIDNAGSTAFTNCLDCAESNNKTYASILINVASQCGLLSTAAMPTQTGSSNPCASQCAWTDSTSSCTDLQCDCQAIQNAGQSAFTNCLNCAETLDPSYANQLLSVSEQCSFTATTSKAASATLNLNPSTRTSTITVPPTQHSSGQKLVDGGIGASYIILMLLAALAGVFGVLL